MKILIIGFGFVGKATYILKNEDLEVFTYDIDPNLCNPRDIQLAEIVPTVDVVFIALPTPTNIDGSCYTRLIDKYIRELNHKFIVIRSTVPIGYCDSKEVFFMPEFLTEANWEQDFIHNKHWLFGIYENCPTEKEERFKLLIGEMIESAYRNGSVKYNNIHFGKNKEMEMNKLIRNTFLATKVSYFNEIYDLTEKLNINYKNVVEFVKLDERIGDSHMTCPGYGGYRGYGGTCFPKDTCSLYNQFMKNDMKSYILQASLDRNERHDRPQRDWLGDVNRTNVKEKSVKTILVTGGASKVGAQFCRELLENPRNKIVCMDTLHQYDEVYIEEYLENPNFKFVNFDIKNKIFLPHVDEIYHLACIVDTSVCAKNSVDTLSLCFNGTKNILDLCRIHKCKLFYSFDFGDHADIKAVDQLRTVIHGQSIAKVLINEYSQIHNVSTFKINLTDT
jgi:UDPglucose 6-dehydrogenase